MHATASTSREHYKSYNASEWYARILSHMAKDPDRPYCIADMAMELGAEKSTISARMNELRTFGEIEYAGKMPSRSTGVTAQHYKVKPQPNLF